MIKKVIKRDGRVMDFDQERIINAIFKAARAVGGENRRIAAELSAQVMETLNDQSPDGMPTVEEIQDAVEKVLIENGHARTAKAYILYRKQHQDLRDLKNFMVDAEKVFQGYVNVEDWRVNENSNMNYSLQGLNNHIISAVTSKYWLQKIYPEDIRELHTSGDLHIHDLSLLAPYCCGWDLADLLSNGFGGVAEKVESSPAKHLRTALGQIVNFFYTLQGEAAGAQAFADFDTYLAPFVHYDRLDYAAVRQALQEFVFNLNVPTRVGFQTPFVNITMDIVVPKTLADEPVIVGGKRMERTYKEFQHEMDMINTAFCEVMMEGDAKGRIFTFPIPTYNISKEFDWESTVVTKVLEMTAKYGIPYFANFVNSDMSPEDVRSMCCRLRLDNRELRKRGGGLFGANPLTGSIGVVTLNMPRIGYLSVSKEDFLSRVGHLMTKAKESLLIKRRVLENMTEVGLYPYSKFYLRDVYQRFGSYWKNHFNTIGLVGMNEAMMNFMGKSISDQEGYGFALEVLDYMRNVLVDFQEETGDMFNLEATPAEGVSYRLPRLDRALYPDIICAGDGEAYYSNSTQLPVNYTSDIFEALDLQEPLQTRYTGGTVFHGFLGERVDDVAACKSLLKKVMYGYRIPYFTVTPTFSVCNNHGYIVGEHRECPICQGPTEVWSRVVGYYRPVQNWNKGKQSEFSDRMEYAV